MRICFRCDLSGRIDEMVRRVLEGELVRIKKVRELEAEIERLKIQTKS